jgi:hypothetical protein
LRPRDAGADASTDRDLQNRAGYISGPGYQARIYSAQKMGLCKRNLEIVKLLAIPGTRKLFRDYRYIRA